MSHQSNRTTQHVLQFRAEMRRVVEDQAERWSAIAQRAQHVAVPFPVRWQSVALWLDRGHSEEDVTWAIQQALQAGGAIEYQAGCLLAERRLSAEPSML